MGQPDESPRKREPPVRQPAPTLPIAADPAALAPESPPPTVPLDLARVRSRGAPPTAEQPTARDRATSQVPTPQAQTDDRTHTDRRAPAPARTPAARDLTGPTRIDADPLLLPARRPVAPALDAERAAVHAATRGALAVLDPPDLRARARALDVALADGSLGPLEARAFAETLGSIRALLRERGATVDDPALHRAVDVPAPAPAASRPRRAQPTRPRLRSPAPTPALPDGAVRLDPEGHVSSDRLLRHATNLLRERGLPSTGKTFKVGGRTLELPDLVTEPVAAAILARFAEAVSGRAADGHGKLTAEQRVRALRDARDRLDDYVGPIPLADSAAVQARVAFEDALVVQSDGLAGLRAAEALRADVDPRFAGLAAPTLEDTALVRNIDVLLLALDDAGKGVTAATRLQAKELSDLSAQAAKELASGGFASRDFPAARLGFIGGVVFLRALLNGLKALIYGGDLIRGGTPLEKVGGAARLLEGLFGGLYFMTVFGGLVTGDTYISATALAKYAPIGRNLVWTSAVAQLLNGAIHLGAVALGNEKFRRTFVTDVLYGGAGSLGPGAYVANKLLDRAIARAERRQIAGLVGQLAPTELSSTLALEAAEFAEASAVRDLGALIARKSVASRIAALAGPISYYVALVDVPLQTGLFALADADRVRTRTNITLALLDLQYLAGGISGRAIELQQIAHNPHLAGLLSRSRARALADAMEDGIAALRSRHAAAHADGTVPALSRRLAAVGDRLNDVRRDDPASVVAAARDVLAQIRAIFGQAEAMYVEELRRLDEQATLFRLHEGVTLPKPNP